MGSLTPNDSVDMVDAVPVERKRRREDDDEDDRPTKREGQVFVLAWRFTFCVDNYPEISSVAAAFSYFCKEVREQLEKAMRDLSGKKGKWVFQREATPKEGHDVKCIMGENHHYQGYVNMTTKRRPRSIGGQLGSSFPGIWVAAASDAGKEALRQYCMKKDGTYREGPWADRKISPQYKGEDLPTTWRPWQQHILFEIQNRPDNRTINWVHDAKGGIGKSTLVKYLVYHNLAAFMTFLSATDLAHQVVKNDASPVYVFDLPRTKSEKVGMDEIYTTLEAVKNGLVMSGKYDGGKLIMNSPHIWVFSNFAPDQTKMSADRFKIWAVDDDGQAWKFLTHAGVITMFPKQNRAAGAAAQPPSSSQPSSLPGYTAEDLAAWDAELESLFDEMI